MVLMKTYYGLDDKYILFTVYLLLRTFKTTIKRNVKNFRLFSTPEETNEQTKNQYFIKIYYFLRLIEFFFSFQEQVCLSVCALSVDIKR